MSLTGHAYLVAGMANAIDAVVAHLRENGIETAGNPDVSIRTYNQFLIDDARELTARASSKALRERRVFIIAASTFMNEAQNALLKTIEEPIAGTLFFLITPAPHSLLPTLRSRTQLLTLPHIAGPEGLIDAKRFLSSPPAERIEQLKPLLEKDEDDKRDLGNILMFLSSLERMLEKSPVESRQGLEAVYRARKYAGDKGSLLKPLLEQVALLVQ